jgi:glycosyltransferase involved in cell wall biosynthesis
MERHGVPVIAPPPPLSEMSGSLPSKALKLAISAASLTQHLARRRPAIVHFFLPEAYLVGTVCSSLTGRPRLVMSRRSLNDYQCGHPLLARLERVFHRRMSLVLGNSRAVVQELSEEGVPAGRLGLIYNGIDIASLAAAAPRRDTRAALDLPADAFVMVLVANLIPYKGHLDLLSALALVRDRLPRPWRLLCVGRDDGILPELRRRAVELGLEGHVLWLGARPDVPDLLAASDLGLLTSHQEGFSNAVLEAMAAGLPLVVTDVGGNAEAVLDGATGRVVPPRDPARLAAAILELALDPRAVAFGRAGARRVATEFSIDRCVRAYEAAYDALMEGRAPPCAV